MCLITHGHLTRLGVCPLHMYLHYTRAIRYSNCICTAQYFCMYSYLTLIINDLILEVRSKNRNIFLK